MDPASSTVLDMSPQNYAATFKANGLSADEILLFDRGNMDFINWNGGDLLYIDDQSNGSYPQGTEDARAWAFSGGVGTEAEPFQYFVGGTNAATPWYQIDIGLVEPIRSAIPNQGAWDFATFDNVMTNNWSSTGLIIAG